MDRDVEGFNVWCPGSEIESQLHPSCSYTVFVVSGRDPGEGEEGEEEGDDETQEGDQDKKRSNGVHYN